MEKMLKSESILRMSVYATSIVKKRKISTFLFHPFELEARLLHGFADVVLACGARDHKRVGGRGAHHGETQPHQREGGQDGVDARLRRGDE